MSARILSFDYLAATVGQDPTSLLFARYASILLQKGDAEKAIAVAEEGVMASPRYAAGRVVLAEAYLSTGKIEGAVLQLVESIRLEPDNARAIRMLAQAYDQQGLSDKTEKLYTLLNHREPNSSYLKKKTISPILVPISSILGIEIAEREEAASSGTTDGWGSSDDSVDESEATILSTPVDSSKELDELMGDLGIGAPISDTDPYASDLDAAMADLVKEVHVEHDDDSSEIDTLVGELNDFDSLMPEEDEQTLVESSDSFDADLEINSDEEMELSAESTLSIENDSAVESAHSLDQMSFNTAEELSTEEVIEEDHAVSTSDMTDDLNDDPFSLDLPDTDSFTISEEINSLEDLNSADVVPETLSSEAGYSPITELVDSEIEVSADEARETFAELAAGFDDFMAGDSISNPLESSTDELSDLYSSEEQILSDVTVATGKDVVPQLFDEPESSLGDLVTTGAVAKNSSMPAGLDDLLGGDDFSNEALHTDELDINLFQDALNGKDISSAVTAAKDLPSNSQPVISDETEHEENEFEDFANSMTKEFGALLEEEKDSAAEENSEKPDENEFEDFANSMTKEFGELLEEEKDSAAEESSEKPDENEFEDFANSMTKEFGELLEEEKDSAAEESSEKAEENEFDDFANSMTKEFGELLEEEKDSAEEESNEKAEENEFEDFANSMTKEFGELLEEEKDLSAEESSEKAETNSEENEFEDFANSMTKEFGELLEEEKDLSAEESSEKAETNFERDDFEDFTDSMTKEFGTLLDDGVNTHTEQDEEPTITGNEELVTALVDEALHSHIQDVASTGTGTREFTVDAILSGNEMDEDEFADFMLQHDREAEATLADFDFSPTIQEPAFSSDDQLSLLSDDDFTSQSKVALDGDATSDYTADEIRSILTSDMTASTNNLEMTDEEEELLFNSANDVAETKEFNLEQLKQLDSEPVPEEVLTAPEEVMAADAENQDRDLPLIETATSSFSLDQIHDIRTNDSEAPFDEHDFSIESIEIPEEVPSDMTFDENLFSFESVEAEHRLPVIETATSNFSIEEINDIRSAESGNDLNTIESVGMEYEQSGDEEEFTLETAESSSLHDEVAVDTNHALSEDLSASRNSEESLQSDHDDTFSIESVEVPSGTQEMSLAEEELLFNTDKIVAETSEYSFDDILNALEETEQNSGFSVDNDEFTFESFDAEIPQAETATADFTTAEILNALSGEQTGMYDDIVPIANNTGSSPLEMSEEEEDLLFNSTGEVEETAEYSLEMLKVERGSLEPAISVNASDLDLPVEESIVESHLPKDVIEAGIINGDEFDTFDTEPEEKALQLDTSVSLPDHVLTPTFADIYLQQDQPGIAKQIYERLLEKDPDNDLYLERIEEIDTYIALHPESIIPKEMEEVQDNEYHNDDSSTHPHRTLKGKRIDPVHRVKLKEHRRKKGSHE